MDNENVSVEPVEPGAVAELVDDVYDGLYREVVSREVAHLEGRPEGRTVVLEMPDGEGEPDFISFGQPEMVNKFDKLLDKDKVTHRGVEVGGFPTDEVKVDKLRSMIGRRIEAAQAKRKEIEGAMGLPAFPGILADKLDEMAVRIIKGADDE
ncbi:hypothetical protein ES703_90052 [subsurface metagenome]